MALAYAQYLGNGTNRNFNVTFPFISKDHVKVRVGGTLVSFTWLTATTIQLTTAPANNAVVDVRRVTPRDRLLVDFKDASVLVETDLDLSALQVFYLSQEAFDLGEASLGVTEDGSYSALNRRISNVLDPVNNQDVVTKLWAETAMSSQLSIAAGHSSSANASKNAAAASETNANASKNAAAASASAAASSSADALASKNSAAGSADSAWSSKNAAAASETNANASKNAAATSASQAAAAASAAALWNPASYYTKSQINDQMDAKAPVVNPSFQGKTAAPKYEVIGPYGENFLASGNSDNANYGGHNIVLSGWWGLGMRAGNTGDVMGFYDFRVGKWDVKHGYYVDGYKVWSRQDLNPFAAGTDNRDKELYIYKDAGFNAVLSKDGGAWGACLRVETRGNGQQTGPNINFHKQGLVSWAFGIKNWTGSEADHLVWMHGGNETNEGNQSMMLAPSGHLWTAAYGWLHTYFGTGGVGEVGTYALLRRKSGALTNPGDTVDGSDLAYADTNGNMSSNTVTGTWRCMGYSSGSGGSRTTTYKRIL